MKILNILKITIVLNSLLNYGQSVVKPQEAIALALENNYDIKIVNNQLEVAENNKSILNSGYLPTITGIAGASFDIQDTEGQLANGDIRVAEGAETRRYNASINLNYTLFDGMGRYYNYKRLKEEFNLSELQARQTIENIISQLLTVYYDVARQSENLKSLQQTLDITQTRLKRTNFQFDYGQNNALSVLNAKVDINNDTISVINAKQSLILSKRDLNIVTGNSIKYDFEVDTLVTFLQQLDKTSLFEKAKRNNITMLQNETNININQFLVKASKSGYLPSIGLTGAYGWNEASNNSPLAFVIQNTTTNLSAGINLTWNLFDGGASITRVRNAKLNLENQEHQKAQLELDIERNFNNAWDLYQNRLAIYKVQEENIKTAKNNFERTEAQFKLGQVTSIEFREAQLNLLRTQLSRNSAKYDAKLAEIAVLQLSGELLNVKI